MTQGEVNSMSAHQGIPACRITVAPSVADVWRVEAKKVLMFNHEPFEDYLDYVPAKQLALADIFRDATAVIDALGWNPDSLPQDTSVEVPLTPGHVEQLHKRRCDLLDTNLDLIDTIGPVHRENEPIHEAIHSNRRACEAINYILDNCGTAATTT
jgi:hypothetical protein